MMGVHQTSDQCIDGLGGMAVLTEKYLTSSLDFWPSCPLKMSSPPLFSSSSSSKASKMSMLGWWMVHTMVLPVLTMLRTVRITMAAARASRPALTSLHSACPACSKSNSPCLMLFKLHSHESDANNMQDMQKAGCCFGNAKSRAELPNEQQHPSNVLYRLTCLIPALVHISGSQPNTSSAPEQATGCAQ